MITKIAMGLVLSTVVVMKDGLIEVNVQEKHPNGSHVHLYVPATVATWGVSLAPQEKLRAHLRGRQQDLTVAANAVSALEKVDDAVLLEVDSPSEHVRMETRGGDFVLDVDDHGETVHVRLPIRAARKVIEDLRADAPKS